MAVRTLPANAVPGIVWLSSTKGLCVVIQIAPIQAHLYITTDGGVTWGLVSGSQTALTQPQSAPVPKNGALCGDSAGNIYAFVTSTVNRVVKFTKGTGDTWTGVQYNPGIDKSLMHPITMNFGSDNRLHLNGLYFGSGYGPWAGKWYSGVNDLTTWASAYSTYSSNASGPGWIAATKANGANLAFSVGVPYAPGGIPITWLDNPQSMTIPPVDTWAGYTNANGKFDPSISYAIAYTTDGKLHMFWPTQDKTRLFYSWTQGASGSWSTPVQIATLTNYQDDKNIGYAYTQEAMNSILWAETDGTAVFVNWVEKSGSVYTPKSIRYNGTSWDSVVTYSTITDSSFALLAYFGGQIYPTNVGSIEYTSGYSGNPVYAIEEINNYAPLQPSGITPTGGAAVGTLTPTVGWTFGDPNAGDTQSAYQIVIYRQSDSVQMYDSGKVTSNANSQVIPGGASLAFGVYYQVKIRTWDALDLAGPYSNLALFKTSTPPVATITSPTNGGTITTNTPTIAWTYSDAESTPQLAYRVIVKDSAGVNTIYDSGTISSSNTSHIIPNNYLQNTVSYKLQVILTDSDGITGSSSVFSFTVNYVTPPTPTLIASLDPDTLVGQLSITIPAPANDSFHASYLKIYRKAPADAAWTLLEDQVDLSALTVDKFDATTGWTQSGVGIAPTVSNSFKEGTGSLNLGATGAGAATYSKNPGLGSFAAFTRSELWAYIADKSKFSSLQVKFGQSNSNYYYFNVPAANLTNGAWNMLAVDFNNIQIQGTPNQNSLTYVEVSIVGVNAAITLGNVKVDLWRFINNSMDYTDYTTANDHSYIYGVSTYNSEQPIESVITQSSQLAVVFPIESKINTFLVPMGYEDQILSGWMDGADIPSWRDNTETKYYQTRGASKPVVFVNAIQSYKEGKIDLKFFDIVLGGRGLEGIKALENIATVKPILLRTWWGENYYISVDGEVGVERAPGISWNASFSFTEISI